MKQLALVLGFGACLVSGCSGTADGNGREHTEATKDAITGGQLVAENIVPYSSAVKLPGCSGVKIGPRRFLMAAHCIRLINPSPGVGARVPLTNSLTGELSGAGATTVTADRFYTHPTFWPYTAAGLTDTFDIAVLDVTNDTPSIPALPTDSTAFGDGWLGTLVAYGCDQRKDMVSTNGGKKQLADFVSLSLAEFQFLLLPQPGHSHSAHYQRYMIFDGQPRYPGAPPNFFRQGCPGDSGGPIFRWDDGWKVAGINSHGFDGTINPTTPLAPIARFTAAGRVASVAGWLASPTIKGAAGSITNALTGKCLGVAGSTTSGARIVQEICGNRTQSNDSQYWRKVTRGDYSSFVNERSGMCMQALSNRIEQRICDASIADQDFAIRNANPLLTSLRSRTRGYAGVNGIGDNFGSVNVDIGADEGNTRMRWIWTP